jgi:hypothetical protein
VAAEVSGSVQQNIFDGGPPSRLEVWLHLRKYDERRVLRLVLAMAAIAWLPIAVLASAIDRYPAAFAAGSFFADFSVHARYLIALPLFVIAESVCMPRLGAILQQFADADLVQESDRAQFAANLSSTRRLLDSNVAEGAVIIVAYLLVAAVIGSQQFPAWHRAAEGVAHFSVAGWWALLISLPLLLVFQLGWLWRLALWTRLLWLTSRLRLHLLVSHPDRSAGLAFVGFSVRTWAPVTLATSVIVAGTVANQVIHEGIPLLAFKFQLLGLVVFLIVLYTAPLLVFYPCLVRAWRAAVMEYGTLADRVGHEFERRWLVGAARFPEDPLQTEAFSATTDLYQIVANVYQMRFVPLDVPSVLFLVLVTLLPFIPLLLLAVPLDVVLKSLADFMV